MGKKNKGMVPMVLAGVMGMAREAFSSLNSISESLERIADALENGVIFVQMAEPDSEPDEDEDEEEYDEQE